MQKRPEGKLSEEQNGKNCAGLKGKKMCDAGGVIGKMQKLWERQKGGKSA